MTNNQILTAYKRMHSTTSIQVIAEHAGHRVHITAPLDWDEDSTLPISQAAAETAASAAAVLVDQLEADGYEFAVRTQDEVRADLDVALEILSEFAESLDQNVVEEYLAAESIQAAIIGARFILERDAA